MSLTPKFFVLQAIDPDHGSPVLEARFCVGELGQLKSLLEEAGDDRELERTYVLDANELAAINECFATSFDPEGREVWLTRWRSIRNVPYLVHSGYELPLMLEGRKQLARFHEVYPPHHHFCEEKFDRYVTEGMLHKEVVVEPFEKPEALKDGRIIEGLRTIYYTCKGEEWRVPAWKLIKDAAAKSKWSRDFERMEGMLFGYEEWQNDWWIEDLHKRRREFGCVPLCCVVSPAQLASIEQTGCRALPATHLILTGAVDEEDDAVARRLASDPDATASIRLNVKSRPFLDLVDGQPGPEFTIPAGRVVDLTRNIVGEIAIVARRTAQEA
jgi:hypothetical protein